MKSASLTLTVGPKPHLSQLHGTMGKRFHSDQPVTWSSLFEDILWGLEKRSSTNSSLCGRIITDFCFFFLFQFVSDKDKKKQE